MRARAFAALATAMTMLLALGGCGYALVGRGVVVDPTIKKIGVPTFTNATGKPALDQKITQRVIEELLRRGRFDVVQERSGVDALVEGELLRYQAQPVGFSEGATGGEGGGTTTQASRYAITVTAKIRYGKVGVPEPIWSNDAFQFRDEYEVGSDPASFFDREEQAIDRLATSFARSLVAAMLEAF
jgi:lipopolysaccharide assembly LptE-like protein